MTPALYALIAASLAFVGFSAVAAGAAPDRDTRDWLPLILTTIGALCAGIAALAMWAVATGRIA